jgi:hypothetical protein
MDELGNFRKMMLLRDGAGLTDGQLLEDYIACSPT